MQPNAPIPNAQSLRARVGRVAIALQARQPSELFSLAESALRESRLLEFRLDALEKPQAAIAPLKRFLHKARQQHGEIVAIATCRRKPNGGQFSGTLADELNLLKEAVAAGCSIIDLEIESAEQASATQLQALRQTGAALLVSFHDFAHFVDPATVMDRMRAFQPDFLKIIPTAHSLMDNVRLLRWMDKLSGSEQVVALAMGEEGALSRILSLRSGAAFTFAAPTTGAPGTAPGQFTAHAMRESFRVEQVDRATRIYGVVGNPVAHSLSPLMQNAAFHRERFDAVYLPLLVHTMEDLLEAVRELPLSGLSITMPFKQQIMPHLANLDPLSARLGACNTVRLGADRRLYGFNTDVAGVVRPLERRLPLRGAQVLVLGAGGAARAAVFGLVDKGARVFLCGRNADITARLADEAGATAIPRSLVPDQSFDVLVNATPCGMVGHPQPLPLLPEEWNARVVFDLVYNPLETPLLRIARERGCTVIQGVEMFVQQGARQFELWTGKPAPEAEMMRTVLHALEQRTLAAAD